MIAEFSLSIGDTAYNFDSVFGEAATPAEFGIVPALLSPDRVDAAVRSDVLNYTFTAFDPAEYFQFQVDLDPDSSGLPQTVDFQTILFDVDGSISADNALVTVRFGDSTLLSGRLPDFAQSPTTTYLFSQAVPEPTSFALVGIGGMGLMLAGWRRRKATVA